MLKSTKLRIAAVLSAFAALMAVAGPAQAQNQQTGLVNVAIEDTVVQLPIAIAANVCDVNVAVLAQLDDESEACRATADSAASAGPSGNGGGTTQEGLVNVLVDDVVIQAPISVAANICDVNVAVLAEVLDDASACRAVTDADAQAPGGGGGGAGADFTPVSTAGFPVLNNDPADNDPTGLLEIGAGTRVPDLRALRG